MSTSIFLFTVATKEREKINVLPSGQTAQDFSQPPGTLSPAFNVELSLRHKTPSTVVTLQPVESRVCQCWWSAQVNKNILLLLLKFLLNEYLENCLKQQVFFILSILSEHPDRMERSGLGAKPHFSISCCVKAVSKASRRLMFFYRYSFLPLKCCVDKLFRVANNVKDFKGLCRHSHLASWILLGVKLIGSLQWGN